MVLETAKTMKLLHITKEKDEDVLLSIKLAFCWMNVCANYP